MQEFPSEFQLFLCPDAQHVIKSLDEKIRYPVNNAGGFFFIVPSLIEMDLCAWCFNILDECFSPYLIPITATVEAAWTLEMTQNFREKFGKTMNVRSIIFDDPAKPASKIAHDIGLIPMLRSDSFHRFAEALTGLKLESGWGTQVIRYSHGHYVGPHNDHHPEYQWARRGYVDVQLMFSNESVEHQWFIHEDSGLFERVWDINISGAVSVFRQPFWHQTTPLVGKTGHEVKAGRWVIGQVFRIIEESTPVFAATAPGGVSIPVLDQDDAGYSPTDTRLYRLADSAEPLSRSILWTWQRRFYERAGLDAWDAKTVPCRATTGPSMARSYAQIILDLIGAADQTSNRIDVIELGAGSGRLAFFILTRVTEFLSPSRWPTIRYIITDGAHSNVRSAKANPQLGRFVDLGLLDFATYDSAQDLPLRLEMSNESIGSGPKNRLTIFIANYFFDSIEADLLRFSDGMAHQSLFEIFIPDGKAPSDMDSSDLSRCQIDIKHEQVGVKPYHQEVWDDIVTQYAQHFSNVDMFFPIGALRVIEKFRTAVQGPQVWLVADKGYSTEKQLADVVQPTISLHGSISLTVNFEAISRAILAIGGFARIAGSSRPNLTLACFGLDVRQDDADRLLRSFGQEFDDICPEDVEILIDAVAKGGEVVDASAILAALRLSRADPLALKAIAGAVRRAAASLPRSMTNTLSEMLHETWQNNFTTGPQNDLAFEIATIFHTMGDCEQACEYYNKSLEEVGPHPKTFYNFALCFAEMGKVEDARTALDNALKLNPNFTQAREKMRSLGIAAA